MPRTGRAPICQQVFISLGSNTLRWGGDPTFVENSPKERSLSLLYKQATGSSRARTKYYKQ